ncbi:MAG: hypothetical protein R3B84_09260 [Zavarzinella sp.]
MKTSTCSSKSLKYLYQLRFDGLQMPCLNERIEVVRDDELGLTSCQRPVFSVYCGGNG